MKLRIKESGSALHYTIVIIVFVVLLGVLGFAFWQNFIDRPDTSNSEDQTQVQGGAEAETIYLTLHDYDIRLPLTETLSQLTLGPVRPSAYDSSDKSVVVGAPQLDGSWTCEADQEGIKGSIGIISITEHEHRSGPYAPDVEKKIGEYTYGFEKAGSNCTTDPRYDALVNDFQAQFNSLESF